MTRLCAIVPHHRTEDQTLACVRALAFARRPPDRILVVDNDDETASQRAFAADLSLHAELVPAGWNRGFSGGCNVGLRAALARGSELILIVNSDVIAPPDAIGALLGALEARPDAGIVGPVVVTAARPARIESAGIGFSRRSGRMRLAAAGQPLAALAPGLADVDATSGAFMLLRRSVLERVGLFDEEYFFGFEDLDLCLRARAVGFAVVCSQMTHVFHVGAATIGARSPRRIYFATRNHLRLARRRAPLTAPWQVLRSGCIAGYNLAHALVRSPIAAPGSVRAWARGVWDYVRGRYGVDG